MTTQHLSPLTMLLSRHTRRRAFITLLGGAAAWPLTASAQQPGMPVIGYLSSLTQADSVHFDAAFRRGLSEMGYVEGQNVRIEYRWITDRYSPLPAMAADLVQRQVAMIGRSGHQQYLLLRPQQQRSPSSLLPAPIQSNSALWPVSTDRAEISPAFGLSSPYWRKSDCSWCVNCCPRPSWSRYSSIQQVRLLSHRRGTRRPQRALLG